MVEDCERDSDDACFGIAGPEHGSRHRAGDAELVEHVGDGSGQVTEVAKPRQHFLRNARHRHTMHCRGAIRMNRLKDRVAIVSGAGSVGPGWGNGRAIAVRFAEEGAKVFAVDRDPERLRETVDGVKKAGGTITTHLCDVTKASDVAAMVEACLKAFGRIDV